MTPEILQTDIHECKSLAKSMLRTAKYNSNRTTLNGSCYFQDSGVDDLLTNSTFSTSRRSISPSGSKHVSRSPSPSRRKLTSAPRPDDTVVNHKKPFLVRHKDNSLLENRDFSSFARPKPRRTRSKSPTRRPRSTSPSRLGTSSVLPLPGIYCMILQCPYPKSYSTALMVSLKTWEQQNSLMTLLQS